MKLVILYNDIEDYVLYIDGKAYQDIDHTWAECMLWLAETIKYFHVEFRYVDLKRSKYPEIIN